MLNPGNRAFIKHVKGLFDPNRLYILREQFVSVESKPKNSITDREKNALNRGESTDAMRMQDYWYDVWRNPVSLKYLLDEIGPYIWVTYPVQVRHIRASGHKVPWHQDVGYMRLLGERGHQQVITCFIPLEIYPSRCSTIQFAFDNIHQNPDYEYPHVPLDGFGAGIQDNNFTDIHHFDLKLGDALIFGDYALHRTYTPPNCCDERRSLEFRLILPEHAIQEKDYFDVEKQEFLKCNKIEEIPA